MNPGNAQRITVLHLVGRLHVGGAERQLVALAPLFDPERFRVIVATMQPGGELEEQLREAGVELRCLNFRMRHFLPAVGRLRSLLRQEEVGILHTHMYYASWYGRIAGLRAGVPVMITTDHGHDPWKKPWHVAFERYALKRTALRIAVSQDVAEVLRAREKVPEDKLRVIPNGVDVQRFQIGQAERDSVRSDLGMADETLLVGTVGRLVKPKALHVLIEAAARLLGTIPETRLLIVGEGPLRGELERHASGLGIGKQVFFAGARSDIPAVLAAMDVFVLSSQREGLPVALLEAMAAGKPIVATRVGGIPEAVTDRREALLVSPDDPNALAAGIGELARRPDLAAALGRRAAEKAAGEFSIAAVVEKLETVYSELLSRER